MAKAFKIIAAVLLALVALVVIAALVITWVIDPNEYKPQIRSLVKAQANIDLDIQGDMDWSFWPSLGLEVGRVEARIAGEDELFAALDEAVVSVAVWPLLFGNVRMDGVTLDGLELNLVQLPEGANWDRIGPPPSEAPAATPEAGPAPAAGDSGVPGFFVPRLAIRDARVRYRAPADNTDIVVEQVSVTATDISPDEAFPVQGELRYQDQNDLRVDTSFATTVALDLADNRYRLAPFRLDAEIAGLTSQPVSVHATADTLAASLEDDSATVRGLVVETAGTRTTAGLDVERMSTAPVIAGEIRTDPFDANMALRELGMAPIATGNPDALRKVSFQATLGGEPNSLMLRPLTVKIDDSTVEGFAGIDNLETGHLAFELHLDRFVADGYLPPDTQVGEAPAPEERSTDTASGILPPLSDAPLLPLDTIRGLLLDGRVTAGEFTLMNIQASDMAFVVTAKDGRVALESARGKALSGSFDAGALLDAAADTPKLELTVTLDGIQLQPLAELALQDDLFIGTLDLDARLASSGNSEQALVENARGTVDFAVRDGTVRGVNLHNTLLAGINDILGSFRTLTTLLPAQASGRLPEELSRDTRILDLLGKARLEKEVAYLDKLNAQLDKGTVTGKGFLNLRSQEFDVQFGMKSPQFSDNRYFRGRTWPLRCHGQLTGNPAKWCGPDKEGFEKLGKEIAAQAARDKIGEKLGIEAEGDSAEEVIRNAAEKKAMEKANQKLEEGLKKLFK